MITLTHAQRQFVNSFDGEKRNHITDTLLRGEVLFAEVVVCMSGQYSTGSLGDVEDAIPALDVRSEIEAVIAENIEDYKQQITEGERDEDDEWEGELMAVRWNSDDTLSFYAPENLNDEVERQTLNEVCGH